MGLEHVCDGAIMSAKIGEAPITGDKTIFIATRATIAVEILMMLTFKDYG